MDKTKNQKGGEKMITISLCMIVKNEQDTLGRCLDSAKGIADEIIVVDTGSTDSTKEIARQYTQQIYDFPWNDDFAAARNFSFSKAQMDYCMWLDADDVILPADWLALLELKQTLDPQTDVVMLKYHTAFDKNDTPLYSYYRERLLRRSDGFLWEGRVHEVITPRGNIYYSDAGIAHKKLQPGDPDRNLRIYEKMLAEGNRLDPRQQFYYARELVFHRRWQDAKNILTCFLDDRLGWIENNIDACRQLAACCRALCDEKGELDALLHSFSYDVPRAEVCCDIGEYFLRREEWRTAAYWYQRALECERSDVSGGFVLPDCYGYIPALQLCLCCHKLGNRQKAMEYNELAGQFKPDSEAYQYNKQYFNATSK